MSALPKGSLVLVTGANGWIGSHVVDQLIRHGYRVRGTVRTSSKAEWLKEYVEANYGPDKLEVALVPDMSVEGAFDEAVKDTTAFIHVASDLSLSSDPNVTVTKTVKGVVHALSAARKCSTLRFFVYTSSVSAAYILNLDTPRTITADTWADDAIELAYKPVDAENPDPRMAVYVYCASKALAERAVWKAATQEKLRFVVNTILPDLNFGPLLDTSGRQGLSSGGFIPRLYQEGWAGLGYFRSVPSQHYIDVRDTARLHVAPLLDPSIQNERIFAAASTFTWDNILEIMKTLRPDDKHLPEPTGDHRRDLHDMPQAKRGEEILRNVFDQAEWVALKDSVEANIQHISGGKLARDVEVADH